MEIVPCMEKEEPLQMPLSILLSGTGTHTGTGTIYRRPLLGAGPIPSALLVVSQFLGEDIRGQNGSIAHE